MDGKLNMTNNEYIKNALKTNTPNYKDIKKRFDSDYMIDILHSAIGLSGESGELLDAVKKHLYYGKSLDIINLKEEAGDILWFLSILLNRLDISFEEVMEKNIEKLKARYGEKFSEEKAINRNILIEREVLEK
jgi:NTP pyrophosphatase (non-canonical NTP hydrolase)